jgi:hypothetical protein
MTIKQLGIVILLVCVPLRHRAEAAVPPTEQPIPIATSVAQMFVDDFLIEWQEGLQRSLHQPRKDSDGLVPVLTLGNDLGAPGTLQANGTIVFDKRLDKYVMFAIGFSAPLVGWERVRLMRFTSPDAMNWIKGDEGNPQIVFPRNQEDLKQPGEEGYFRSIDLFSCYYDDTDPREPYKGWLFLFSQHGTDHSGLYYMASANGIEWKRGPRIATLNSRRILQDGHELLGPHDVSVFNYDRRNDRFLATFKFTTTQPPIHRNLLRSRAYLWLDALNLPIDVGRIDRVDLVPAATSSHGDLPHDEYYASTAWRYESLFLGGLKVWHWGGDYPYSPAGSAFLKLVSSRDGVHWNKVPYPNEDGVPEVWVPNGHPEGGNQEQNDAGYISEFSQGPLRIGDELIYYYGCSSTGKNHPPESRMIGGGIYRARLRIDGFVSVDGGTFTTKPLTFDGSELLLNSIGPVKVDLLRAGNVLGTAELDGDDLTNVARFDGKPIGKIVSNNPVQLRFTIGKGGQLFSFQIMP